jgi:pimeloyl-ACP methyl ester carboxylesterase
VVLLASLGRGADDFADLGTRLAEAGFCALAPEPRGVCASASPLQGVTMANLADDVVAVIRALADGPATVVGHAFGNRVARTATAGTPVEEWWTAGSADVLVVQPAADVVAVPRNATMIVERLGERASMVTIPGAGHALLPEQPAAVAAEVLAWLDRRRSPVR